MDEPQPYQFGRIGGALCLDFANTASWQAERLTTEHLNDFRDLIRWCTESSVIGHSTATALLGEAEQNSVRGEAVLTEAKELRETLYRIFIALSRRNAPPCGDLERLNETLAQAPLHFEVRGEEEGFSCERKADGADFGKLLGPVVWSAAELLASGKIEQIKCCAAETCGWLFLDGTKNHSRRWCDMADCGTRAKSKRYYRKKLSVSRPATESAPTAASVEVEDHQESNE
jgi:predicted RNA-binding Zn ribbon-like protein